MASIGPSSIELQETKSEAPARLHVGYERVRNPMPLTEREREVLELVARGLRGGAIAQHLVLSPETIKSHVQNAMTKLGAHTRAHAVAIALGTGQIEADAAPTPPFRLAPGGALR